MSIVKMLMVSLSIYGVGCLLVYLPLFLFTPDTYALGMALILAVGPVALYCIKKRDDKKRAQLALWGRKSQLNDWIEARMIQNLGGFDTGEAKRDILPPAHHAIGYRPWEPIFKDYIRTYVCRGCKYINQINARFCTECGEIAITPVESHGR
mgnify:CR=1 FL=1